MLPQPINSFFKYGTFVYLYKWVNHISNLLQFLMFQFFDDVDILSCYDLYMNPLDPMMRKLFSTKLSILCVELNEKINPKLVQYNSSPIPTMTQEPSVKAHF